MAICPWIMWYNLAGCLRPPPASSTSGGELIEAGLDIIRRQVEIREMVLLVLAPKARTAFLHLGTHYERGRSS